MKYSTSLAIILTLLFGFAWSGNAQDAKDDVEVAQALKHKMKSLKGEEVPLSKYQGKVVLIVNTASKCGLTPQYNGLQKLFEEYEDEGLVILGFPCNQFGGQEPGTESEIQEFCQENYGVKFPMFSKIDVNGDKQAPLYKYLTSQELKPGGTGRVKWNFEKFLLNRDGKPVHRFSPRTKPNDPKLIQAIKDALASE